MGWEGSEGFQGVWPITLNWGGKPTRQSFVLLGVGPCDAHPLSQRLKSFLRLSAMLMTSCWFPQAWHRHLKSQMQLQGAVNKMYICGANQGQVFNNNNTAVCAKLRPKWKDPCQNPTLRTRINTTKRKWLPQTDCLYFGSLLSPSDFVHWWRHHRHLYTPSACSSTSSGFYSKQQPWRPTPRRRKNINFDLKGKQLQLSHSMN